jgi:hypothetical protein
MMVGDGAVSVVFFQALGTMDFVGREILRAIEGEQIIAIQKAEPFQGLTTSQSREDTSEGRPEVFRFDGIQNLSHPSVTRHILHAEDHLQVFLIGFSALVESQHGRILQGEHGQSTHERIGQGHHGVAGTGIGDILEGLPDTSKQGIGGESFAR